MLKLQEISKLKNFKDYTNSKVGNIFEKRK